MSLEASIWLLRYIFVCPICHCVCSVGIMTLGHQVTKKRFRILILTYHYLAKYNNIKLATMRKPVISNQIPSCFWSIIVESIWDCRVKKNLASCGEMKIESGQLRYPEVMKMVKVQLNFKNNDFFQEKIIYLLSSIF